MPPRLGLLSGFRSRPRPADRAGGVDLATRACTWACVDIDRLVVSREGVIGIAVCAVAIIAMVVGHWLGDESGIDDPAAFFGSAAGSLIVAAFLFGRVIPDTTRHRERADRAARHGIVCSVLGLVTVPAIFCFPVVLAGLAYAIPGGETPDDD